MKERLPFTGSDHYAQITGLELTDEQLEEIGEKHAKLLKEQGCLIISSTPPHMKESIKAPASIPDDDLEFYKNLDDH